MINGFLTDGNGDGTLVVQLDFLLTDGVYPFNQYDPTLAPAEFKTMADAAGGTLRIITHLTDPEGQEGHGLVPGVHELAFDWVLP